MMQKYEYRYPRFSVDIPVKFIARNSTLEGNCTVISTQGMRIEVLQPLLSNTYGRLSVHYQDRTFEFNARVVHGGETQCGLELLCASDEERCELSHLVKSLTTPRHRSALVLVQSARR